MEALRLKEVRREFLQHPDVSLFGPDIRAPLEAIVGCQLLETSLEIRGLGRAVGAVGRSYKLEGSQTFCQLVGSGRLQERGPQGCAVCRRGSESGPCASRTVQRANCEYTVLACLLKYGCVSGGN